jgi:ribosomal protein S18 acetylase RimI-like enzyme
MVELRDATPDDAEAIATVHVASWQVAYRGLMPDVVLDGLSVDDRAHRWAERLAVRAPRTHTVLVVDDDAVLGFASTGPARDDDDPAAGELYAIYLDPRAWSRGHGARVHAGALESLRTDGFTRACLWVLDANERALQFYRRQGWVETGETKVDRDLVHDVALRERKLHRDELSPTRPAPHAGRGSR